MDNNIPYTYVPQVLPAQPQPLPLMGEVFRTGRRARRRLGSENGELNAHLTLKLSNLPLFYNIRKLNLLLKHHANLDVDRTLYYIDELLDENGESRGEFLIRFVRPEDARNVRLKLNNLMVQGRPVQVRVESRNHRQTSITPEFEMRFQQYMNTGRLKISNKLMLLDKKRQQLQETLVAPTHDPVIESELDAIIQGIEGSQIQPSATNMNEDNALPKIETTVDSDDKLVTMVEEDDDLLEMIEYDDDNTELIELTSSSDSSVDCEELCLVNYDEDHQKSIDEQKEIKLKVTEDNDNISQSAETNKPKLTVTNMSNKLQVKTALAATDHIEDFISVTDFKDHNIINKQQESLDNQDVPNNIAGPVKVVDNQDKYKDTDTNRDKECSEMEINQELQRNEINEETRNNHDKTKNNPSINNEDIANKTVKNIVTNKMCFTTSTEATVSVEVHEKVTSNSLQNLHVPVAVRRKIDSSTVVQVNEENGTAPKNFKLQVSHEEDWVFVNNMQVTLPHENRLCDDYGLNPDFLDDLGLKLPLSNRIFVYWLDEKVTEAKLYEVFSMAGEIRKIQFIDSDIAEIEYDHPVEAVQAISMLDNRKLYNKMMNITMEFSETILPSGLSSVGKGFGENGEPLRHVGTIIEQRDLNEILCEMGKAKKIEVKNSSFPFLYHYKKDKKNNNNSNKSSSDSSVFKFSVPGTGESNETPSKVSDSALKELNQILKEQGLIPEGVDCKNVKEVLSALKNKTTVNEADLGFNTLTYNLEMIQQPEAQMNWKQAPSLQREFPPSMQNIHQQNFDEQMSQTVNQNISQPNFRRKQPLIANHVSKNYHPMRKMPLIQIPPFIQNTVSQQNFGTNMLWNHQNEYRKSHPRDLRPERDGGQGIRNMNKCSLVFRNLPQRVSEETLANKLLQVGDLEFCKMTGRGRALVRFRTVQDSDRCQRLFHKSKVEGQIIEVFYE